MASAKKIDMKFFPSFIHHFVDMVWCVHIVSCDINLIRLFTPFDMAYKIFVSIFSIFFLKMCWSLLVCVWKVFLSMTNDHFNWATVALQLKNELKKIIARNTYTQTHAFRFGCRVDREGEQNQKAAVWNFYMRNWISLLIHFGNLLCVCCYFTQ